MNVFRHHGGAFLMGAVALALFGCSAPTGPATPPASGAASRDASGGDLIVAGASDGSEIYLFSYPDGKPVKKFRPPTGTLSMQGMCSDKYGGFYVTAVSRGKGKGAEPIGWVYYYQRGRATPSQRYHFEGVGPHDLVLDQVVAEVARRADERHPAALHHPDRSLVLGKRDRDDALQTGRGKAVGDDRARRLGREALSPVRRVEHVGDLDLAGVFERTQPARGRSSNPTP